MANKQEKIAEEAILNSESFFYKNKKAILIALGAIIILIAGFICYRTLILAPREDKASTAMAKGQEYFDNEMFDKALNGDGAGYNGFLKIADDYSGTKAANLANLYAGLCYANLGNWKDAEKYLENYSSCSDAMVTPMAMAALGDAYAHNNELDKAVDQFKKAASTADKRAEDGTNNSISPTCLIKAGEILESQGNEADALKLYQEVKDKYVNSPVVQSTEIDKYIERAQDK